MKREQRENGQEISRLKARIRVLEEAALSPGFGKPHAEVLGRMLELQHAELSSDYYIGMANGLYMAYTVVTGKDHPLGLVSLPGDPEPSGIVLP